MESRYRYDDWEKANNLYKNNHIKSIEIASSVNLEFPDVTFAIPAYMRPDTIQDAIKSVVAQKSQYSFIIMIVDDSGSDDIVTRKVLELLNKYPNIILYKNEKNLGQAANWNRCIELAKTKWVVLLHDDDMVCEEYLEKVYSTAAYYQCTEVGVFQYKLDNLAHKEIISKRFNNNQSFAQMILSKLRNGKPFEIYPKDIFQFIVPSPGCWFFNREDVIKNGGFNPEFGVTLDGVFHFKNIIYGKVIITPEFLMIRRIEKNTFLKEDAQIAVIDMLYHFGLNMLKKFSGIRQKYYKILLDVSTVYLANGIKFKYEGKFNIKKLLKSYGVNRFLCILPSKIIFLINCCLLSKLVLRKTEKKVEY